MPTPEERKKAKKLITFAEDNNLAMFDELQEANDKLEEVVSAVKSIPETQLPEKFKIEIEGASLVTLKGDKGDSPTEEELINLIKPLIPEVEDGKTPTTDELVTLIRPLIPVVKNGETPSDKKLLELISPLIPEVEDGYTPVKGKDYFDGKDGSPDTPVIIRDKLSTLQGTERLDAKYIKNLPTFDYLRIPAPAASLTYQLNGTQVGKGNTLNLQAGTGISITTIPLNDGLTYVISASGGGATTPAPPDMAVQFNQGGVFGGTSDFIWDYTQNILTVATGGSRTLVVDPVTKFYGLGDLDGAGNSSFLSIDDQNVQTILFNTVASIFAGTTSPWGVSNNITLSAIDTLIDPEPYRFTLNATNGSFGINQDSSSELLKRFFFGLPSAGAYWFGDIDGNYGGSALLINDTPKTATLNTGSMGWQLDGTNNTAFFGTSSLAIAGVKQGFEVDRTNFTLKGIILNHPYLSLDNANQLYIFGDVDGTGNGGKFIMSDVNETGCYDTSLHTGKFGINTQTPAQNLHVVGTARITASDGTSTTIMGRDADGDVSAITVSTGLSLSGNVLTATGTGATAAPLTMTMGSIQVTASTTAYNAIGGATFNGTETNRQFIIPKTGTIANLFFVTDSAQPGTGTMVVTVRKNAAGTALTATVGAGAGAGTFSDITHSFAVTAGDVLSFQWVNNASSASAGIKSIGITFT